MLNTQNVLLGSKNLKNLVMEYENLLIKNENNSWTPTVQYDAHSSF